MTYKNIIEATFLNRPNRFISHCKIADQEVIAHVKNTGRCKELLIPGVTVYLEHAPSPTRKTDYSLIAVDKGGRLINMDSSAPNQIAYDGLQSGEIVLPGILGQVLAIKKEHKFQNSRFDLYVETTKEEKILIEIKGVTLEEAGGVMFPDAPTARGVKHVKELILAKEMGYKAFVIFIVQMDGVAYFTPNVATDKPFTEALMKAHQAGVGILAYDCHVTPDFISVQAAIDVRLPQL